jgi:hypothetical protein
MRFACVCSRFLPQLTSACTPADDTAAFPTSGALCRRKHTALRAQSVCSHRNPWANRRPEIREANRYSHENMYKATKAATGRATATRRVR